MRVQQQYIQGDVPVMAMHNIRADYVLHGRSLTNPAFIALLMYRVGQWAHARRNRVVRAIAKRFYLFFNYFISHWSRVYLPPEVRSGEGLHIVHATGFVSIHPDTVIGNRVGIMHNVTIGTNMHSGAPVIGDDVFIGVGTSILGAVRIGDRVRIAANTAVTTNVPDDSVVVGSPAKIYPRLGPFRRDR